MSQMIWETCWNQQKRYDGVKEYYKIIKEVCNENEKVELLGLFKPVTQDWNWAYFLGCQDFSTWQIVNDEINERYKQYENNITQSMQRWYTKNYFNPKPSDYENLKYLQIELDVWQGINVGTKEYFDAHVNVFKGEEGVWFQGQYHVWNDPYNWAHFYWFKDGKRMKAMSDASWRATGQLERTPIIVIRHYERIDIE